MADTDKNILITPNVGQTENPRIDFTGGGNNTISLKVLDEGVISFEGANGQLFSIADANSGTVFSVNDISGIPSIEVEDTGTIKLAEFGGNVGIGTTAPISKLHVTGATSGNGVVHIVSEASNQALRTIFVQGNYELPAAQNAEILNIRNESTDIFKVFAGGNASLSGQFNAGSISSSQYFINDIDGTGDLLIKRNGSEKMRLTSDGKLGIGTTAPNSDLEINGTDNARIRLGTAVGQDLILQGGIDPFIGVPTVQPLKFLTSNAERMRLTSDGALLVGTDTNIGGSQLTVAKETFGDTAVFINTDGTNNPRIILSGDSTGSTINATSSTGASELAFATQSIERMRLTSDGKLGIGTTAPSNRLTVTNTGGTQGIDIFSDRNSFASSQAGNISFKFIDDTGSTFVGSEIKSFSSLGSTFLIFTNGGSERMRLTSDGKLGIGTTSPSQTLDVAGNTNISGNLVVGGALTSPLTLTDNASIAHDHTIGNPGVYISHPGGAYFHTGTNVVTGAIRIQLPATAYTQNDMMSFYVDIFDYASGPEGESISLHIYGYNHTSGWINTGAVVISDRNDRDYTVRFGRSATRDYIYIAELNSSWNYPQIVVRDFNAGFSADHTRYDNGWNIDFVTDVFEDVTSASVSNYPVSKKLGIARTITLSGDVTGSVAFDGSANVTLPTNISSINNNLTIDAGVNTELVIKSDDGGKSQISLLGDNQGTGRVYVGQNTAHGGGIEYNGDNNPSTTGAGSDYVTLYRRANNVDEWTARNLVTGNDWEFRAGVLVGNDLTVTGNLTVNGSTTSVNSTVTTIDDPIITLGDNSPSTLDTKDRGIEFKYGDGSVVKTGFFGMDRADSRFKFYNDATNSSENISGQLGEIQAAKFIGSVQGNADTATKLQTARSISLAGDIAGTVSFDGSSDVSITATVQPNSVALGTDTTGNYVADVNAGSGIVVTGADAENSTKTVSHANTSDVTNVSVDNANGTVIQDISLSFDEFGHVTSRTINSVNLDSRYYTEAESDSRFVNVTGDTMSGELTANAIHAGQSGTGRVSLTTNDGHGNASVAFNHANGTPDFSGSSARIETDVDGTTAGMRFELADSVTAGQAVSLTRIINLTTSEITLDRNTSVSGTLIVSGNTQIDNNATINGVVTATDFNSTSDFKLKENIETAPGIETIQQLRGVEYDLKSSGKHASGVIAQEVEAVLPHIVSEQEDGTKVVAYQQIIGHLIEAVKDLKAEIEELKANK